MFLPANTTSYDPFAAVLDLSARSTSNDAISVICSFPLSGQYGPGARALYYVLVVICIFATHVEWMRGASLAAALLFPAVAAIHAIIITSTSHTNGAVDLDIFGCYQLCAIGVLCVPITVRYSKTYFRAKGRNMVFMWTALNLAGLLSLIVAFYRAMPSPCTTDSTFSTNVTSSQFWGLQHQNPQTVCATKYFPNGCVIDTIIRKDASNPSQWIPTPGRGMTLNTATLLCAACCIPAIISLLSVWEKVMLLNWRKRWRSHAGGADGDSTKGDEEKDAFDSSASGNPNDARREQRQDRRMETRIKLVLGLVERIVFSVCILAIVVLGEENFWSHEMRSGVEPITSIGQWGPIVGAALAVIGSLWTTWGPPDKPEGDDHDSLASGEGEHAGEPQEEHPEGDPQAGGEQQQQQQAKHSHRDAVNRSIFRMLKILGTPDADRFAEEMNEKKFKDYPQIPGEKERNPEFVATRENFRKATALSRQVSRQPSMNSMRPSSEHEAGGDGDHDGTTSPGAGPSHSRSPKQPPGRTFSSSTLQVPEFGTPTAEPESYIPRSPDSPERSRSPTSRSSAMAHTKSKGRSMTVGGASHALPTSSSLPADPSSSTPTTSSPTTRRKKGHAKSSSMSAAIADAGGPGASRMRKSLNGRRPRFADNAVDVHTPLPVIPPSVPPSPNAEGAPLPTSSSSSTRVHSHRKHPSEPPLHSSSTPPPPTWPSPPSSPVISHSGIPPRSRTSISHPHPHAHRPRPGPFAITPSSPSPPPSSSPPTTPTRQPTSSSYLGLPKRHDTLSPPRPEASRNPRRDSDAGMSRHNTVPIPRIVVDDFDDPSPSSGGGGQRPHSRTV